MPRLEQYAKIKRVEASILARSGVSSSTWRTAQSSGKGSSRASRRRGATWGVGQRDAYQRKEVGSGLRSRWFLLRPSGDHRRRRLEAAGFASSRCGRRGRCLLESLGGGNARTSSSVRGKGREAEAAADSRDCKGRNRNVEGGRTPRWRARAGMWLHLRAARRQHQVLVPIFPRVHTRLQLTVAKY